MTQPILFSSGIELSPLVISSGLLLRSWDVIASRHDSIVSDEGLGLSWKLYKEPGTDVVILAFEATADSSSKLQPDLVPYSDLLLSTKSNPEFSVNNTAVTLFYQNHEKLVQLKSEINISKLIVTGDALGGCVASLFTISLLESFGSRKKRPLCITFGSTLVGDKKLQKAISRSSYWKSCFLHVVSHKDPLPRLFITNSTTAYMPFGTYFFCSDASSTCFDDPNSILEILIAFSSIHAQNQGFQSAEYGNIVGNLNHRSICKDFTTRAEDVLHPDSLLASCISLQLEALGLTPDMQQQHNIDVKILETKMKEVEGKRTMQRRINFDPPNKLNNMKRYMAQLEWYKNSTKEQGIGYYDSYKNMCDIGDIDVTLIHRRLTVYWEYVVEEAKLKPQSGGLAYRYRFLYSGSIYRTIVEPLAIADYYKEGGKDYVTKKRSKHFELLEEWWNEAYSNGRISKKNVKAILAKDSCFWAHVEEALLSCKELKAAKENEEALTKLLKFEEYVYELLQNYAVSPEIFLQKSSFMRWWNEYKEIKGTSYTSPLVSFMNDVGEYEKYSLSPEIWVW